MAVKRFAGDRFSWLSTDTKPSNVLEGATGIEVDTGKIWYRYLGVWGEVPLEGGLSWVDVDTNYTASKNQGILTNTSLAPVTVTLPVSPQIGDTVAFSDANGTFLTNNLTIARNGELIQGLAEDLVVDVKDASFQLIYNGAATGWKLYSFLPTVTEVVPSAVGTIVMASDYTAVLADANNYRRMESAVDRNVVLPTNATTPFPLNTEIHFEQSSTGIITITGAVGVTLRAYEGYKTKGQYWVVTAKKVATDEWVIIGGVL